MQVFKNLPVALKTWPRLLFVLAMAGLTGCAAVGPNYTPPKMETASDWHTPVDPALLPQGELVRQWWTLYNDPLLNRLIETATENNLDLMTAIARVEETRARLGIATGKYYPTADVTGSVTRQRTSENSVGS